MYIIKDVTWGYRFVFVVVCTHFCGSIKQFIFEEVLWYKPRLSDLRKFKINQEISLALGILTCLLSSIWSSDIFSSTFQNNFK